MDLALNNLKWLIFRKIKPNPSLGAVFVPKRPSYQDIPNFFKH